MSLKSSEKITSQNAIWGLAQFVFWNVQNEGGSGWTNLLNATSEFSQNDCSDRSAGAGFTVTFWYPHN